MAKAILKAGLSVYDAAEQGVAEARERLRDFVTEVREEMNGGVNARLAQGKRPPVRGKMELVAIRRSRKRCSLFLLILYSLTVSLTSCATTGESFTHGEPVPGKASLYIYYAHGPFSSSLAWPVYLDGIKLTELRRGGYLYSTVSSGIHTISMKRDSIERSLNLSAETDGTYYLRLRYETNLLVPTWVLEPVSETQALDELKDMKLQP